MEQALLVDDEALTLVPSDDQRLRTPVPEVTITSKKLRQLKKLSDKMLLVMFEKRAVGLAANQVGVGEKMFVMVGPEGKPLTVINPIVLETSPETILSDEGCLSYPGLWLRIARPRVAKVRYVTLDGHEKQVTLTGIYARCFLHETEHLTGVSFTDHVSRLKLELAMNRVKKMRK